MAPASLIACHECDLLQQEVSLPSGGKAVCLRCGATLYARRRDTIERTLALILAAAILFVIGNAYPVVTMEIQGQRTEALVWQGAWRLRRASPWWVESSSPHCVRLPADTDRRAAGDPHSSSGSR